MTRRILFLAALVCGMVATASHAQKVSEAEALQRAKAFLNSRVSAPTGGKQYAPQSVTSLSKVSEGDAYYVFNAGNNGGFVIVSGDERLGTILGYSTEGRFDAEAVPDNMRAWLKGYDKSVEMLATAGEDTDSEALAGHRASKAAIAPLIKTKWSQGWPYNLLTPETDGQHCLTGCVATSMAMLMNYWQYPTATAKIIPAWSGLAAVPAGTKIEWSSMSNYYGSEWYSQFIDAEDTYYNEVWAETTEQQQQAVAKLMKMCGMAVQMDYGLDESKAQATAPLSALKDYFGYKNEMKYLLQDNYTIENWEQIIYNELQQQRPVMYGGMANDFGFSGGHSFLVDGYDGNGFFHINWGVESGLGHGYYSLAAQRFNQQTSAIVGIQPTVGGTIANVPTVGDYTTDAQVLKLTGVTTDGPVWAIEMMPGCGNVILTLANSSNKLFKGLVTVCATDEAGFSAFDDVLAQVPANGSAQVVVPYYEFMFDYGKNIISVADFTTGSYIDGQFPINVERQRIPNLNIEYTLDGVNDKGIITYGTPCTLRYKITSQWEGDTQLKARLCLRNLPSGEDVVRELGHITFGQVIEGSVKIDAPSWDPLPDYCDFDVTPMVEFYSDTRDNAFMNYYYQNGTQCGDSRTVVFCRQIPRFATEPQKVEMEQLNGYNDDLNMRPAGYYVLGHYGFVGFDGLFWKEDMPEYFDKYLEIAWRDYQENVSYYTGILRCGNSSKSHLSIFDCPSDNPYTAGSIQRTLKGKTVYFPYNVNGLNEAIQRGLYKNEVGAFLPYESFLWLCYSGGSSSENNIFTDCYLYYYPIVGVEDGIIGISDDSHQEGKAEVYDLMGRRLTQPTKPGIYVKDGRKVMVK